MKTMLLALVLIGATVALLAWLPHGQAGGVRLEPRARPDRIAQEAPVAEVVSPAPMDLPAVDLPAVDHPELVPIANPAPEATREAVPQEAASPVRIEGLTFRVTGAEGRFDPRILDLWQKRTGAQGPWKYFMSGHVLPRGAIEVSANQEKRPDGTWIEIYEGGQPKVQGQIRNGREVGLWTYWHENGERSAEGRYVIGERHGLWTSWHADGSKESVGDYNYRKREGPWIDFHPGGKKQQVATYVNGVFVGRVVRWHANGTRESEGFCVGGDLDGPWRGWHAEGTTSSHGSYRYGRRVGRWTFFGPDGELDRSQSGLYEHGEKVAD